MAAPDQTDDTTSSTASPADTGAGAASYTIEISVTPDGISVGVESADQESSEESGAGGAGGGSEATPVPSIKAALTMALDIYRNDGQMPEGNGEDDMASGFGNAQGAASGGAGAASGTGGM